MDQVDVYMKVLRAALAAWNDISDAGREAVIETTLRDSSTSNRAMIMAFGVMTLESLRTGQITIGKLERDKVLNGGM